MRHVCVCVCGDHSNTIQAIYTKVFCFVQLRNKEISTITIYMDNKSHGHEKMRNTNSEMLLKNNKRMEKKQTPYATATQKQWGKKSEKQIK